MPKQIEVAVTKIRSHGSRVRNDLLQVVRNAMGTCFRFNMGTDKKSLKANRALYDFLSDDSTFAYKDINTRTGYAEHTVILTAIRGAWISAGSKSIEIVFAKEFDPISVSYAIEEWCTGSFKKGPDFTEAAYLEPYKKILKDVEDWAALAEDVTLKICQRMAKKARASAGIDGCTETKSHIRGTVQDKLRAELLATAGETDSDPEEDDDDDDLGRGGDDDFGGSSDDEPAPEDMEDEN
ncbi:hypothetical protein C8J56DRAFT_886857 [Mycena floridula]|nr:hypothetical protein C8J56DRAFT_886857 [Mycena floridula]